MTLKVETLETPLVRSDPASPLKEMITISNPAMLCSTQQVHKVEARLKNTVTDESKLTLAQRKAHIDQLVNACGQLSDETKQTIAESLKSSKLKLGDISRLLDTINSAVYSCDDKAGMERAFKALVDPKAGIELMAKDRDIPPRTLLDHICTLSETPAKGFVKGLGSRKDEILQSMLTEIADAMRNVNQGTDTSCVSTVAMSQGIRKKPAEYARMITELVTQGDARLVTDQGTRLSDRIAGRQITGENPLDNNEPLLLLNMRAVERTTGMKRSITEALLQGGAAQAYGAVDGGLYNGAAEKFYENYFGVGFERIDVKDASHAVKELRRVTSEGDGYNMVSVKWNAGGQHAYHALEILKIDGDTVTFRNPHGKEFQNIPQGVQAVKVDGERAIYRMSLSELTSRLNYALVSVDPGKHLLAFGMTGGYDESQPGFSPVDNGAQRTIIFETAMGCVPSSQITQKHVRADENTKPTPTGLTVRPQSPAEDEQYNAEKSKKKTAAGAEEKSSKPKTTVRKRKHAEDLEEKNEQS